MTIQANCYIVQSTTVRINHVFFFFCEIYCIYQEKELLMVHQFCLPKIIKSYIVTERPTPVYQSVKGIPRASPTRVEKTSLERVLQRVVYIIRSETLGRRLARLFAHAKRLPRVSDRIICRALRKTLFDTRFFMR